MNTSSAVFTDPLGGTSATRSMLAEAAAGNSSAVSWGAIFAGAVATAALSLILLILGTGLGLSSVSPWAQAGISAAAFGVTSIVWVSASQIIAAGLGGYLAGRLRTKWISVHTDEVYFRDTAHGFLAWALASLVTAAMLVSVIGSIVSGGAQAGASAAASVASAASPAVSAGASEVGKATGDSGAMGYFVDSLFRKDATAAAGVPATDINASGAATAEIARIFAVALRTGAVTPDDQRYLTQVVAQRTGLSQADAEQRMRATFARAQATLREVEFAAKEATDKARKASAYAALWLFISLLIGAFTASVAATFGGRQRDN